MADSAVAVNNKVSKMREDYIVLKRVAVCRFCGTLLSRDVESVPACDCGQNKKLGENMHNTIAELSPLERAYLNAVWQYHGDRSSTDEDAAISKEVFRLIKAGLYELAAVEAGKSDVTLEIWTSAVAAAKTTMEV